jgi:integrase
MRIQLTKRAVMGAQPKSSAYELRDVSIKGLLLRVQPSGHKSWIVEWARGRRRTLGALSELTLEEARAAAAQAMAEAMKLGDPTLVKPKRQEITLDAFLADHYGPWVSGQLKWGDGAVDRIRTGFRSLLDRRVTAIDQWLVDRWWSDRIATISLKTKAPVSKVTASRELAALRSALSKAQEWGFVEINPLAKMRQKMIVARKVVRYLSADEERRLRNALSGRDRGLVVARATGNVWRWRGGKEQLPELPVDGFADHLSPIVLLAMNTGMRKGELLSLTWQDVSLVAKQITIRAETAKSGKERHIPLNTEALEALRLWCRRSDGVGRIFSVGDFKKAWSSMIVKAQIRSFRFHDLRHHFASMLVMNSVDLNTVRELLGHADIKMTLRYAHLAPDHLAAAVAKLGAQKLEGGPAG